MLAQITHGSFPIRGMTCASCVNHVQHALESISGVVQVSVNFATETASIDFDPAITTPSILANAVEEAGYEIPMQSQILKVEGMSCASCVSHVEKALMTIPEVLSATVNLATQTATISTLSGRYPKSHS